MASLVATSGYLRPGERLNLLRCDMVEPLPKLGDAYGHWNIVLGSTDRLQPQPTKTGIYDDAVILDHRELAWMNPLLRRLVQRGPSDEYLWSFDEIEYRREFERAAVKAGLGHLHLVPYSLRHAGPSWDSLVHKVPQREIQRRGRWRSAASVVRYERSARVLSVLRSLQPATLRYLEYCETHLADLVLAVFGKGDLA